MTADHQRFPYSNLGFLVGRAARETRALLDHYLADAGTTFATWTVLATLEDRGAMIQGDLAREVQVEGPTMVRRVDQLEAGGLVRRQAVPTDRRAVRVELTAEGRALYRRLRRSVEECERALASSIDPTDLRTTREALVELSRRARQLRGA